MSKKNIILTIILAFIFIIVSYVQLQGIGGYWMSIISFGGMILICVLIALNIKKDNDGYAPFGTLVKHFAITIAIALILSTVFDIIQVSIMDESQKETYIDKSIEAAIDLYRNLGISEDQLAVMEEDLEEDLSQAVEPAGIISSTLMAYFVYLLVSFIPAVIFKKNPPT